MELKLTPSFSLHY